ISAYALIVNPSRPRRYLGVWTAANAPPATLRSTARPNTRRQERLFARSALRTTSGTANRNRQPAQARRRQHQDRPPACRLLWRLVAGHASRKAPPRKPGKPWGGLR